jgi:ABC-2 type transport system permease protein
MALVAREEFRQTVGTKAFWIGLAAFPIIIALGIAVPLLLESAKEARRFAVVDHSGFLLRQVEQSVYGEDLRKIAERGRELRHDDAEGYNALPPDVRRFVAAWMGLEDAAREELVEALSSNAFGLAGDVAEESIEIREFVEAGGAALHHWWATADPHQVDERHDIELTRRHYVREPVGIVADTLAALNERVNSGHLFAYIVIGPDPVASDEDCRYVSNNLTDRGLRQWFSHRADGVIREQRMQQEGIAAKTADWIQASLTFEARKIDDSGDVEEVEARHMFRQFVPLVFTYLLWIAVFTSSQMLITSTIEEKSARIMEILVSSVSPEELMGGKIAGVAGAGLIVVSSWAGLFLAAILIIPRLIGADVEGLGGVAADPVFLATFVVYFLLGYLLYASMLVGLGSLCGTLKEAQNVMWPAMIPLFTAIFSMKHIVEDPNGLLARVLSFVPPFTPFIMMNRAAGPPAWWEILLTCLLLIGSIWLTIKGASRLFRVGVLGVGARPGLGDIVRILLTPPMPPADPDYKPRSS